MNEILATSVQDTLDILSKWCKDNGIWIDPRLQLRHSDKAGIWVFSSDYIPPSTSVVHIPKNSVLSVRNCTLSDRIESVLHGPKSQYSLSLALYMEVLLGESSHWCGYLQSLPRNMADLPLLWNIPLSKDHAVNCETDATRWLKGTQVEKCLRRPDQNLAAIDEYYTRVAEPLILQYLQASGTFHRECPTLQGFYTAYSFVSSRAFLVDAHHGLSMVPIADAFNHSQPNQVHLESDFNVCSQCGSFDECIHDEEHPPDTHRNFLRIPQPRSSTTQNNLDDYYEMVSNTLILPESEVFNTYGEDLTNPELLVRYGFILDSNDNDNLTWELDSIYAHCAIRPSGCPFNLPELHLLWTRVVAHMAETPIFPSFLNSSMIYNVGDNPEGSLSINGDGRISQQLWILLAITLLPYDHSSGVGGVVAALTLLLEFQLHLEGLRDTLQPSEDASERYLPRDFPFLHAFNQLVELVVGLCEARKNETREHLGGRGPDEVYDALLDGMHHEKCALSIMMVEESLLNSCISSWQEILEFMVQMGFIHN